MIRKITLFLLVLGFSAFIAQAQQPYATRSGEVNTTVRKVVPAENAKGLSEILFQDDFEGNNLDEWTLYDADGDGNEWYTFDNAAGGGTIVATSASWIGAPITPENWMVSPSITLPASGEMLLNYTVYAQDPDWVGEQYKVMISTTDNAMASFTETIIDEVLAGADMYEKSLDLADFAGETIFIAFVHYNSTDVFRINIDDVSVTGEAGAALPELSAITVSDVTAATANVNFTASVNGTLYVVLGLGTETLPTAVEVVAGTLAGGATALISVSAPVTTTADVLAFTGLTQNTAYSAFLVLDDGVSEILSTVYRVDFTTIGTGISNVEVFNSMVYPNPASEVININVTEQSNVTIYDMAGRLVVNAVANGRTTLDVSTLENGMYIVRVNTNGNEVIGKIVVE